MGVGIGGIGYDRRMDWETGRTSLAIGWMVANGWDGKFEEMDETDCREVALAWTR
jgi:hypothetical protein